MRQSELSSKFDRSAELDKWAAGLLWAQLSGMGAMPESGAWEIAEACFAKAGILGSHRPWWHLIALPILEAHGYIRLQGGHLQVCDQHLSSLASKACADCESGSVYFDSADLGVKARLVYQCLRKLPEILTGSAPAKDILFPNGSLDNLEELHRTDAAAQYFNSVLIDLIERYVRKRLERDPRAAIRLVEIGSRTAPGAAQKLASYADAITEYCCAHAASASLAYGQTSIPHEYPFLKRKPFDVERALLQQGMEIGAYDVAIASNVLHGARNIANAIRNTKALLKRNGLLFLNELTEKSVFSSLTFGLLQADREDEWLRIAGSPLLDSASWQRALEKEGFRSVGFPAAQAAHLGQQIIVAESDGLISQASSDAGRAGLREPSTPAASGKRIVEGGKNVEERVAAAVLAALSETLKISAAEIDHSRPFAEYGIDSILGATFVQKINEALEVTLNFAVLFDHTTVHRLARYISETHAGAIVVAAGAEERPRPDAPRVQPAKKWRTFRRQGTAAPKADEIAVIGMSGQFPGAANVHAFWENLIAQQDGVDEFPAHYLNQEKFFCADRLPGRTYCKWGGVLEGREFFDPLFFNIAPRDAETMSPHQRLTVQESWKALEDAGYNPKSLADTQTGVFIGAEPGHYSNRTFIGSSEAIIASRLSYFLNLTGPALVVNTACSSSAAAIHLACESLRKRESDLALAGGVLALINEAALIKLSQMEMLSPTGRCRAFDESGDGMVLSEAVAVVVLKRLEDAVADRDRIYGVVVGSGMNQDGASNGITAPSGSAQEKLIASVYRRYGINPEEITYVEAHGTGTRLGDPVEANALARAFRQFTAKQNFCAVGSAKAHVGHTAAAAGVVSLIKVLLTLQHRQIPGLLHFKRLNPLIEFEHSAFFVNDRTADWQRVNGRPLTAALNSFGHSGTNVHLVIREHVVSDAGERYRAASGPMLIPLSARTETELRTQGEQLVGFLTEEGRRVDFESLAYTLQVGREAMEYRLIFLTRNIADLVTKLESFLKSEREIDGCWTGRVTPRAEQALPALGSARGLPELARAWTEGQTIAWARLYGGAAPQRISLPTYPFAKERYWTKEDTARGSSSDLPAPANTGVDQAPASVADNTPLMTFEEVWEECPGPFASRDGAITNVICLLSNRGRQREFAEAIRALAPEIRVAFVAEGPVDEKTSEDTFNVVRNDKATYVAAFGAIREYCGRVDAILNLWPYENRDCIQDPSFLLFILQAAHTTSLIPRKILSAAPFHDELDRCYLESWIGFERSLGVALPETKLAAVYRDASRQEWSLRDWVNLLWSELQAVDLRSSLYQGGLRRTLQVRPTTVAPTGDVRIKQGGTYLLTGGCGGLGLLFAEHLVSEYGANVILTGRSPLSAERRSRIDRMRRPSRVVRYLQADLCDVPSMKREFEKAKAQVGPVHGVIHLAGVEAKLSLFEKSVESFREVLNPKIRGTLVLDEIVADEPLDFVCYFSSSSAILGDLGSCDYAIGNRFQMAYARFRNGLQTEGKRRGRTMVVNWPLWRAGGMGVSDADAADFYLRSSGQRFLEAKEGIALFERLLSGDKTQQLVLAGRAGHIHRFLGISPALAPERSPRVEPRGLGLEECVQRELKQAIADLLKIPLDRLDPAANLADFGFDSIGLAEFSRVLTKRLGVQISPAVFFGHSTVEKLSQHLVARHADVLSARYAQPAAAPPVHDPSPAPQRRRESARDSTEPIAIIGMSGRFPQARNVDEMWEILASGKNAVGEIPADRFDWRTTYGDAVQGPDDTNSRRCGWISGVSEFDPLFFEISPDDAGKMDPRQRLLLEEAWNALEDAAYGEDRVASERIGMFTGVEPGDYQDLVKKNDRMISNHDGILAARLSYFLNLRGPVLAINTACSSSLVAAHQACLSLQAGECDVALVAGVNLILDPERFAIMAQVGMLSATGRCAAFDEGADGMAPGEAIAIVALKRVSAAIADGDPIYAVIRGTGINYDGRTNGITAPSGVAQADLLRDVYRRANVRPEEIDYVVAHGTGTKLGDPVEFGALNEVFQESTDKKLCCALTSTKTNFGHTFAASGLVSLIGLAQALRHEQIPPSLHFEQGNEHIDWRDTPFFVNQSLRPWPSRPDRKRMGAVSSFGMSGTNAHMVVEEYAAEARTLPAPGPYLLVFSARTARALDDRMAVMARAIEERFTDREMQSIAYTLIEGRYHLRHRCAIVVDDWSDAVHALSHIADRKGATVFRGEVAREFAGRKAIERYVNDLQFEAAGARQIEDRREALLALAEFYCQGHRLNASALFAGSTAGRLHLPAYPFARETCWVSASKTAPSPPASHPDTYLFFPGWTQIAAAASDGQRACQTRLIILCEPDRRTTELLGRSVPEAQLVVMQQGPENIEERYRAYTIQTLDSIRALRAASPGASIFIQLVVAGDGEQRLFGGLKAILNSARLEDPRITAQLIEAGCNDSADRILELISKGATRPQAGHMIHENGRMMALTWHRQPLNPASPRPWKDGGVYLVTGGAGALGIMVATEIADGARNATLILVGRSTLTAEKQRHLDSIRARGARVHYKQVDVAANDEVVTLISALEAENGRLNGIIHCAGSTRDNYIPYKTAEEVKAVLSAKVTGALNLDRATQTMALDFVVYFSSVSGVAGNAGQADYAAANAFLDAYARHRNSLVKAGKRSGLTVSINWPLWRDGGMKVTEAIEGMMAERAGMVAMDARSGILALRQALAAEASQVLVAAGNPESIARHLAAASRIPTVAASCATTDPQLLKGEVLLRLKRLFCDVTKLRDEQVETDEELKSYGLDSFLVTRLNQRVSVVLGEVSKTIFYECETLNDVAAEFVQNYPTQCSQWAGARAVPEPTPNAFVVPAVEHSPSPPNHAMPIAIIGMSGCYPEADNLAQFWRNLKAGRKSITEIPASRWPLEGFYCPDPKQASLLRKSCGKWGGFLASFDKFDPLFFGITPRDAENMDPQERLFLQESWKALEDAGYAASQLTPEQRRRTGVFAGVTKLGFDLLGPQTATHLPTTSFASVANRVSHHLNLQGLSMPIDTMCSSALVAIHEACEYLRYGRGDMAIAGAVNLYLHPSTYVGLSARQLLSNTVDSAAFSASGTGFVPGEGVGVAVLKPLGRAVADGDAIYAVIRGSAVNHDGKTAGYATPNPNQQAEAIRSALEQSGLDPASIAYIEAAATGSAMGDALEMSGLIKAFSARHSIETTYRLGSIKPNIGHGESVSGMAQIAKVVLSMQHRTLVPTLVNGDLNPNIDFDRLPFTPQTRVEEWKPITMDGVELPRRAGVTSVGAGGVNAHVILEEYAPDSARRDFTESDSPALLTLSARSLDRLQEYVRRWIGYLDENRPQSLGSIAYTLQAGRDPMPCRLAIVARDLDESLCQLKSWLELPVSNSSCFWADLNGKKAVCHPERVRRALEASSLAELAELWTAGNPVDWLYLYKGRRPVRSNGLPTYPFAERTCWIGGGANEVKPAPTEERAENPAVEFYTLWAKDAERKHREEYLTFCPFEERVPGFSMSRVFLQPEEYPEQMALLKSKQIEMRQVLFAEVDFERVSAVLDIGCGHGTDVIQLAAQYPHLKADGFTITRAQADLGNARIADQGLAGRARIFCADSSKDRFPGSYDLIIGIEVTFHIRNKQALFENIGRALREEGSVLLMDFIGNLRGAIADPRVEISIPTRAEWIELLSDAGFCIDRVIDVSPQIANFLYDPEVEQSVAGLPKIAQDTYRNYTNQAMSLEKGWISYCLLTLLKKSALSVAERREHNARMLAGPTPYPEALRRLQAGPCPTLYPPNPPAPVQRSQQPADPALRRTLEEVFAQVLGFSREDLVRTPFEDLGIGSVNAVELTEAINVRLNLHLPTSLIFECSNLSELTTHVAGELGKHLAKLVPLTSPVGVAVKHAAPEKRVDIAIVGISCRCAGARNAGEFWRLIGEGREAIREIDDPNWLDFFRRHSTTPIAARYGAMDDLELFDPGFFNISPKEAAAMDPAQRIILEESYRALEDAGCSASRLRGQPVGTFIGTNGAASPISDYSHFSMLGADTSIMAARIAYYLDLKGPALAVNTACSSSLVAVDLACRALKANQINLAIAGGITLYTHPAAFLCMNNARMLSPNGECRPFDKDANGIVVGDGVGIVILKRLEDAERNHDQIYGVIRGSGTNQDGQTSGITVPSFLSQCQLEESVYRDSQVPVEEIQYVETHGTATNLGDPIEIHALQRCFEKFTNRKQFCATGSVKANIGHTTAAAGVLGLIKVLLALWAKKIPPSIHFSASNEQIDFEQSAFFVPRSLIDWPENSKGARLAAVSSFGFSGTNAHVVIEEHSAPKPVRDRPEQPALIVLSAKQEDRLTETVKTLRDWVRANRETVDLHNLAYTLQEGREAFEERLAMVASSVAELEEKLELFLREPEHPNFYRGQAGGNDDTVQPEPADSRARTGSREYDRMLRRWVAGGQVDWNSLYGDPLPYRISLPTYPYLRKKFRAGKTLAAPAPALAALHPLAQSNTSDLNELRFSSWLNGDEFFLADHVVKGQRILPGVAYLEMARAALTRAAGAANDDDACWHFRNVAWIQPIAINGVARQVHVRLSRNGKGVNYAIYTTSEGSQRVLHAQGTAASAKPSGARRLDLDALKRVCQRRLVDGAGFYQRARGKGLELGPSFRAIEEVFVADGQVLAKLSLPACVGARGSEFVLHPSIMDAALQAAAALPLQTGPGDALHLPFALESLEVFGRSPESGWVWVRPAERGAASEEFQRLDFDLCDDEGRVRVSTKGLSVRAFHPRSQSTAPHDQAPDEEALLERIAQKLAEKPAEPPAIHTPARAEMEGCLLRLLRSSIRELDGTYTKRFEPWWQESLNILTSTGALTQPNPPGLASLWLDWDRDKPRWNQDPDLRVQVALAEATMRALPEILIGKKLATDVMFPKSSMALVEGIYSGNSIANFFNHVLARAVVAYLEERITRDAGARIRILEIGAGSGGTTAAVLQALQGYESHVELYCYTDISVAFLHHAQKKYAPGASYLTTRLFDVSKAPDGQGVPTGHFDVAIAANVLHATKDIRETLRNAKATLRKRGLLLLNELSRNSLFSHLTFGLLDGWWLYEDAPRRIPGCPALTAESWEQALNGEGFHRILFPAAEAKGLDQQIIIAQTEAGAASEKPCAAALPAPQMQEPGRQSVVSGSLSVTDQMVEQHVRSLLRERVSEALMMDERDIRADRSFSEYGVDSIVAVQLVGQINNDCGIELPTTVLFDYNNVDLLARHIVAENGAAISRLLEDDGSKVEVSAAPWAAEQLNPVVQQELLRPNAPRNNVSTKEPIAVIGMAGRFANSDTPKDFWKHLAAGTDLVEKVSRWELSEAYAQGWSTGHDCLYGSFLNDIDKFDSLFFNISGVEATYSDPQQRVFLEEAWKALEDAGYAGDAIRDKRCGIYVGCAAGDYPRLFTTPPPAQAFWGNSPSVVPARIAYYLNLKGPAISVDTACSSSLVSIHLACQGLWTRETDYALAGGVFIQSTSEFYRMANQAGMLSPTGRCHTFDEQADGFVPGEGAGVFLLKRLSEALADGDHIYGVIRGSGLNQDGASNGITAPSAKSQEALEREVYDEFLINPDSIGMVESHGTGTTLGDPIEFQALCRAFRAYTDRKGYCALGSVKTNIGHAATAAGAAGFMKVLLSLCNRAIPPSLHFRRLTARSTLRPVRSS